MKSPQLSRKSLTGFLLLDFFTTLGLLLSYRHLVEIDSENTKYWRSMTWGENYPNST